MPIRSWPTSIEVGLASIDVHLVSIGLYLFPIGIRSGSIGSCPLPIEACLVPIEVRFDPIGFPLIWIAVRLDPIGSGLILIDVRRVPIELRSILLFFGWSSAIRNHHYQGPPFVTLTIADPSNRNSPPENPNHMVPFRSSRISCTPNVVLRSVVLNKVNAPSYR